MMLRTTIFVATDEGGDLVAAPTPSEDDSLALYLREIGAVALLSKAEERDLVGRIREGDEQAKHRFVEANLRLVVFVAKRYSPYTSGSLDILDLIQAGSLGLMQAVERYDPERGTFANHAVWWIRQAISRTLCEQGRTIRVPGYVRTLLGKMARLAFHSFEEQGAEPTEVQLAAAMGLTREQVWWLLQVDALPMSLDVPMSSHDERTTLAESLADCSCPDPETVLLEQAETSELLEEIKAALSCLTEREQAAIILRFGLDGSTGRTLQQVGAQMGICRERARQLQASALTKLRRSVYAPRLLTALRASIPVSNTQMA